MKIEILSSLLKWILTKNDDIDSIIALALNDLYLLLQGLFICILNKIKNKYFC